MSRQASEVPPNDPLSYRAGEDDATHAREGFARSLTFASGAAILVIAILLAVGGVVRALVFPLPAGGPTSQPATGGENSDGTVVMIHVDGRV